MTATPTKPSLTAAQLEILRKRRLMVDSWPYIGPVLVAALLILVGMLWLTAPMFVNPFAVMDRLQADSLDITTLQTMAIMLPIVFTVLCIVVLVMITFLYATYKKEKRYLDLIEQLQPQQTPVQKSG